MSKHKHLVLSVIVYVDILLTMLPKFPKSKEDVDGIAQVTVTLLEPKFESLELVLSNCAKVADLNKAKANHYRLNNIDQYHKRENIRIVNFSPEGNLTTTVLDLLNHMANLPEVEYTKSSDPGGKGVDENMMCLMIVLFLFQLLMIHKSNYLMTR